ncbi:MAG: hypothetical protein OXE43_14770 [Chloroflexi bacterium]|nr:hypothetical protein [Chloroflexota bacterium]
MPEDIRETLESAQDIFLGTLAKALVRTLDPPVLLRLGKAFEEFLEEELPGYLREGVEPPPTDLRGIVRYWEQRFLDRLEHHRGS